MELLEYSLDYDEMASIKMDECQPRGSHVTAISMVSMTEMTEEELEARQCFGLMTSSEVRCYEYCLEIDRADYEVLDVPSLPIEFGHGSSSGGIFRQTEMRESECLEFWRGQ